MCRYLLLESSTQPTCVNLAAKLICEHRIFFHLINNSRWDISVLSYSKTWSEPSDSLRFSPGTFSPCALFAPVDAVPSVFSSPSTLASSTSVHNIRVIILIEVNQVSLKAWSHWAKGKKIKEQSEEINRASSNRNGLKNRKIGICAPKK